MGEILQPRLSLAGTRRQAADASGPRRAFRSDASRWSVLFAGRATRWRPKVPGWTPRYRSDQLDSKLVQAVEGLSLPRLEAAAQRAPAWP